ncbi:MAG: LpqB family beta-propeller domain-containing protein [Actinomycetota bacterium]|nr:LpqB family beta-propeller domain-containing protein [Actinomycetota bacterium]
MGRALTALCLIALTGCAGIPDSGPVTEVDVAPGDDQSTVRYSPTGPAKDALPQDIVRGYLDAMLAYPVTTGTAASFLTPDAAREWKSSAGVKVYAQPQVSTPVVQENAGKVDKPTVDVNLEVVEDASLDPQGRFKRVNTQKKHSFRLARTKGQWRIVNPQSGFLVNRKFFSDYYRPFNNYFFDKSGKRLVADPIYLPVGDQLSTSLMSSLTMGPKGLLDKTARTFAPKGTQLRTSVPLRDDGLAEVQFRDDLGGLPSGAQERLSAQVVWTLRQVDQVTGVRITGGDNVLYPGNRGIQSIDSWASFGPRFGDGAFFGVQKGKIVEVTGRNVAAIDGAWGRNARGAAEVAVDSEQLAVVNNDRTKLTTGRFDRARVDTFSGTRFLRPTLDDAGTVWALDRPGSGMRLRLLEDKKFRQIPIGRLARLRLQSFALSPDGSRYAVIGNVGGTSQVYVGSVLRDAEDAVTSLSDPVLLRPNGTEYASPRSISWATATTVTFLADDNVVGAQVFESRIDGSASSGGTASSGALLPDVAAVALATTGGDDATRYVTDRTKHLWLLRPGGAWERLDPTGVTGLAASYASSTG